MGWTNAEMGEAPGTETCVTMPHLDQSVMHVLEQDETVQDIPRWKLIQQELEYLREVLVENGAENDGELDSDTVSRAIEDCVLTYNPTLNCTFGILKDTLRAVDQSFFESTLVFIIDSALSLPKLFPEPIKLLNGEGDKEIISLSRDKICCILANAFFCTFPDREVDRTKYLEYPRINFTQLFDDQLKTNSGWESKSRPAKVEKLKCFLNYFKRMSEAQVNIQSLLEVVYERRKLSPEDIPEWSKCEEPLIPFIIRNDGTIQNSSEDCLQVDFANKFIGGGTLGNGTAMEEILFSSCPELVCGQVFTKMLHSTDSLLVHGFQQYSSYTGYGPSFQFFGDYVESTSRRNRVVCMDAQQYPVDSLTMQLQEKWMRRELNKCFVSFRNSELLPEEDLARIASGKWGCGVFNGDPLLKCLIQWMAASYCKKKLELYTFGDVELSSELEKITDILENASVGQLYKAMLEYGEKFPSGSMSLSDFIQRRLGKEKEIDKATKIEAMKESRGEDVSLLSLIVELCEFSIWVVLYVIFGLASFPTVAVIYCSKWIGKLFGRVRQKKSSPDQSNDDYTDIEE